MARKEARRYKALYFDLSQYKTTDLEIFDLIREMSETFPWLQSCVNHFEVTNIGTNHDLMELFTEEIEGPSAL